MKIEVKPKAKYLHIECHRDGSFFVYADNKTWGQKQVTLAQMNEECRMTESQICIPLKDFIEVKTD